MPIFRPHKTRGWEFVRDLPKKNRQSALIWLLLRFKDLPAEAALCGGAIAAHLPIAFGPIDPKTGRAVAKQTAYIVATSDGTFDVGFAKSLRSAQIISGKSLRSKVLVQNNQ